MKKFYLFLLLITAVSFYGCNNDKKNDLTKEGLKGKVKYVLEETYSASEKFEEIQKDGLDKSTLTSFNKDGSFLFKPHDDTGISAYKYDSKGNVIENDIYNSDGSLDYKYISKYDSKGNKIEENIYNSDGSFIFKFIYKYDSKGNVIENDIYNSDGSLVSKVTYKYDSKGNKIEINNYDSDGSLDSKVTYKYDSKANKIETNHYNSDGSLFSKYTYKYDSKGNMIEENISTSNFSIVSKFTYIFDSKDNWIKRIENGDVKGITERKIVYYGDKDENDYPEWDSPSN